MAKHGHCFSGNGTNDTNVHQEPQCTVTAKAVCSPSPFISNFCLATTSINTDKETNTIKTKKAHRPDNSGLNWKNFSSL